MSLFIEVDSPGVVELEDPVDRAGEVKPELGGDMPLDIGVQGVAAGEVAEISVYHRINFLVNIYFYFVIFLFLQRLARID
jgi:hypothetical protein